MIDSIQLTGEIISCPSIIQILLIEMTFINMKELTKLRPDFNSLFEKLESLKNEVHLLDFIGNNVIKIKVIEAEAELIRFERKIKQIKEEYEHTTGYVTPLDKM